MPVQTFDTQDDIPEEHRASALETKDGKFAVFIEPDTSGLTSALEKERAARKQEEKARKEAAKRLADLELEAKAREGGLTADKLKEIREQVAAEYEPFRQQAEAYKAKVRELTLNDRVKAMFAKAEFVDADAAWKLFGDQFDLTEDGSQPVVKGKEGVSLDAHIAQLATAYPYLVKGTQASGGGASGNRAGQAAGGSENPLTWSSDKRAAFIAANGLPAYQQLLDKVMEASVQKKAA